jgi:hypothetical protein
MGAAQAEVEQIHRIDPGVSLSRLPRQFRAFRYPLPRYQKALRAAGMCD